MPSGDPRNLTEVDGWDRVTAVAQVGGSQMLSAVSPRAATWYGDVVTVGNYARKASQETDPCLRQLGYTRAASELVSRGIGEFVTAPMAIVPIARKFQPIASEAVKQVPQALFAQTANLSNALIQGSKAGLAGEYLDTSIAANQRGLYANEALRSVERLVPGSTRSAPEEAALEAPLEEPELTAPGMSTDFGGSTKSKPEPE